MKAVIIDTKNLRKAAFAIGFGLAMGKYVADRVIFVEECISKDILMSMASRGNKYAQNACRAAGLKYEKTIKTDIKNEPSNKVDIGFHA